MQTDNQMFFILINRAFAEKNARFEHPKKIELRFRWNDINR